MNFNLLYFLVGILMIISCTETRYDKGFQVDDTSAESLIDQKDGLNQDSLVFETKPTSILLTGISDIRLTSIFKVNYEKDGITSFTGSNDFHNVYVEDEQIAKITGNNWHNHILPGFEAVHGYNFVNISGYNLKEDKSYQFFDKPVLIKTLYYPSYSQDTLNFTPVNRNYFMVSVYNADTNKDGYINPTDLRRIYLFDINGKNIKALVPENYSVFKSGYDPANDMMFIFAQQDLNENGKRDEKEPTNVFWVDLSVPTRTGKMF